MLRVGGNEITNTRITARSKVNNPTFAETAKMGHPAGWRRRKARPPAREKLEYMHRNPVNRGLVKDPKDWAWSSYASYSGRGTPLVQIDFVD